MIKFVLVYDTDGLYYAGDGKWSPNLQDANLFDSPVAAIGKLGPIEFIDEYRVIAARRETQIVAY